MDWHIKRLTPERAGDFLYFFDNVAFCDNPSWADCYCCFFYFADNAVWGKREGAENREYAAELIEKGELNGYLAYDGKAPVGWLNGDDKTAYPRIMEHPDIPHDEGKKTASLVCFTIDHTRRGQGMATALLNAACDDFALRGYDLIEAYPRRAPKTAAENYYGPLTMYQNAGFTTTAEKEEFTIVQKPLK
ncbi:MAG: GNAT family N-acetyltransferase [Spirochaetales bacterium]|nr:GNAT family N-acetyltransferase [Spirochaetales bacterium]